MMDSSNEHSPSPTDRTSEFLSLLGRHERGLLTFVLGLVPNWADTDDILQEVRIRLWEQFDDYDRSRDFGTWARTIAFWQVKTWRKNTQRNSARFSEATLEALAQHLENSADSFLEQREQALKLCLEQIDPQKRSVLDLYYAGEKSVRELAAEIGRSAHAIYHLLERTRLELANCIQRTIVERGRQ